MHAHMNGAHPTTDLPTIAVPSDRAGHLLDELDDLIAVLDEAMAEIVARCKEANVVVGHPHVEINNAQRIIDEGYRFLMCSAPRSYATLNNTMKLVGR